MQNCITKLDRKTLPAFIAGLNTLRVQFAGLKIVSWEFLKILAVYS